ncbi:PIN domain-like protein, partial [Boletus edulis BED1]
MGVAGLWEVLRPAGQVRSLTELAVEDGFNANPSRQRGFRIGIDASIWFFHAAYGREGENPELRTLFFRCCRLLQLPLLPLFVFDGPNRPAIKRGKRVGGNVHWLTQGMKNIIDAFGFERRVASGEAEAELAYLNRVGIIDAVLSDDVDNFLFGATMVIRNPSNTLSGNRAHPVKNAQGKDDGNHVVTYTAEAILSNPSVALSRSCTILIGLLSGGDYIPAGLPGCGQKFATGLARAGFGNSLVKAVKELKGARLDAFLIQWRQDIRNELKTNKSSLLPSKKPSLAASLPDDFPSLPVLVSYTNPITSENTSRKLSPPVWRNDPDPMRIASLCELYFEWGVKDIIVHRFRTVLWPGVVCRAVRRAVIDGVTYRRPPLNGAPHPGSGEGDTSEFFSLTSLVPLSSPSPNSSSRSASPSSPTSGSSPLLLEVLSQRSHASTDSTLEFRVLIDPTALIERAESGVKGLRPPLVSGLFGIDTEDEDEENGTQDVDESGSDDAGIERLETAAGAASKSGIKKRKARREVPTTPLRLWLPA